MQLIDSHAHLDFDDFHDDFDAVLKRAESAGVTKVINIGASLARSQASITLAENYDNIYAVVGVHPEEADNVDLDSIHSELLEMAKSSKRVVGIGETGLDYYHEGDKEKQKQLFRTHIEVAKHLGLPLVVHIRNGEDESAVNETYEILKNFKLQISNSDRVGVIHCFTLDSAWAKRFTGLGFYLGFTGIITYKNADKIREAVAETPLENILIETDAPFLAPQKYRGQRNEPAYVTEVAEKIAEIKVLPLAKIAERTTMNVEQLFKI